MQIFNYGSINIDHIYRVPHLVQAGETLASHHYRQVLGGKGANQSIALARAGAEVQHIGRYHPADHDLLQAMRDAGVNTDLLQTTDSPSGHAIIQVDDQAENAIVLYAGANHSFRANELTELLSPARMGDWLVLQNECSCTAEMIHTAVNQGLQVAFNPAPMTPAVKQLPLDKLSLLFVNAVEVLQLLEADATQIMDHDWLAAQLKQTLPNTQVVVTLGSQGVSWFYHGDSAHVAAPVVEAVDTTGAGDTFIGYFMHAITHDLSTPAALEQACKAAALCVQRHGASSSIPTQDEVRALQNTVPTEVR